MIPVVLGGIALAAVGYGAKKIYDNKNSDDIIDSAKDDIYDDLLSLYDGIENLEERLGLNSYTFPFSISSSLETIQNDQKTFDSQINNLFEYKTSILEKLESLHKLHILKNGDEIKKEKTKDIVVTEEINSNISNYMLLLKALKESIVQKIEIEQDISEYSNLLRELLLTKIIKKNELNQKSSHLIDKTMMILIKDKVFTFEAKEIA